MPLYFEPETVKDRYRHEVDLLSATASRAADGAITLSLANVDLDKECRVTIALDGDKRYDVKGQVLTADAMTARNTFENPDVVRPVELKGIESSKGEITVVLPAKSIVSLTLR